MRRRRFILAVGAWLGACATGSGEPQVVSRPVGQTDRPYEGTPAYLERQEREVARVASARWPGGQVAGPRPMPPGVRADRLRALLAATDALLVALPPERAPEPSELDALRLTVADLRETLAPFTDITAEAEELAQHLEALPETPLGRQARTRARMKELVDLIRLQIMAGR